MTKINPIIKWWVTPKLPPEDIFAEHNFVSKWLTHPIKRRLSRLYLKILQKFTDIKVIAVTGSTGKTTTTEILASILKKDGKTVWSAEGIDPVYNIPNTILKATPKTKYLILEMSVEYPNEMDFYLWLAKPDVGLVTNIATTHTEFLKNKEGVAFEKGKLIKSLEKGAKAVLNFDDVLVKDFKNITSAEVVYFGEKKEVTVSGIKLNKNFSTDFTLKVGKNKATIRMKAFGKQFAENAKAAAAGAYALGIGFPKITAGVSDFKTSKHRLHITKSRYSGLIFDDTYNSNPKAAAAALDTFDFIAGNKVRIAVIGDMLELGRLEEISHREIGKKMRDMNFKSVIGVGRAARFILDEAGKSKGVKCYLVKDYKEALIKVRPLLGKDTALFAKGSRSIHLDKMVDHLT